MYTQSQSVVDSIAEAPASSWMYPRFSLRSSSGSASSSFGEVVPAEVGAIAVRCWCCRDAGTVSHFLLNKYGVMPAQLTDPAVECMATGCKASFMVSISGESGERTTRRRYAECALDDRLSSDVCNFIALAQEEEEKLLSASISTQQKNGSEIIQAIVKDKQPSAVVTFAKVEKVATTEDRAVAAAQSLADIFGDIA